MPPSTRLRAIQALCIATKGFFPGNIATKDLTPLVRSLERACRWLQDQQAHPFEGIFPVVPEARNASPCAGPMKIESHRIEWTVARESIHSLSREDAASLSLISKDAKFEHVLKPEIASTATTPLRGPPTNRNRTPTGE